MLGTKFGLPHLPPSTSRQTAQYSLGIPQAGFDEDRRVREALTRSARPPVSPSSSQARPSRQVHAFINRPGRLTALQKPLLYSATPRVCLDRDPFGVLESPVVKNTRKTRKTRNIKRPKFKPTLPSFTEQLEDVVEAERSLRQEALASSETDVQPGEE
jgi:hypothetical protein